MSVTNAEKRDVIANHAADAKTLVEGASSRLRLSSLVGRKSSTNPYSNTASTAATAPRTPERREDGLSTKSLLFFAYTVQASWAIVLRPSEWPAMVVKLVMMLMEQ
ncbi:hypothetical protein PV326_009860 [Microctonus aethiopoides]|nr:hypothetical protein PV326_009860 [Microctonus aethiopoides]